MTDLHLISHHLCPFVQRAVIVLTEKNIPHDRTYIDLSNKPLWFSEISPLGRVPVLQTSNAIVFESQVIAEYLDEVTPNSLHPSDLLEKARHRSWIEFGSETLNAIAGFYSAEDSFKFEKKRLALREKFERINGEINGRYFSGYNFYMIDGVWGTIFRYFEVFDQITDFGIMADLDKVCQWREALLRRRSIISAVPEGYTERLTHFLLNKGSHFSTLIAKAA